MTSLSPAPPCLRDVNENEECLVRKRASRRLKIQLKDPIDAKAADHERYARFFHHMLDHGVALPPSGYELWTLGTEHGPDEVGAVLEAAGSFEG